ncbi:MAG: peptidoglycan editing factor PgeF [Acidobacteria bacterium]|nr:peptidoglycan editing factor PgeF [Acidobacteriota bacterium]
MTPEGPFVRGGFPVWTARLGDVEVRFTGRGPTNDCEEILRAIEPDSPPLAWAKQVHSAVALPARPGACGEGDALYTGEPGLTLSVVTADCVPVLIAGPEGIAAVHAGWRGIAGGVILATLEKMTGGPGERTAWIGPAIGRCCYEVGEDVAGQVVAASAPEVSHPGPKGKPHLDLQAAARLQLERAGVGQVFVLPCCTRCEEEKLWSYRREGKAAGRNLAFIWRV